MNDPAVSELVLSERHGAVSLLTLNDPAHYNGLDGAMLAALAAALDHAAGDGETRAIVLSGAGPGFCAGARLDGDLFESGSGVAALLAEGVNPVITRMRDASVPIVTAVHGAAAGAGVGLALAGDIVVAARSARFVLSFARLGAAMDAGISAFVQQSIGAARARALALLGQPLGAETAAEWGLVWEVVEDASLLARALAIAGQLAAGPPLGLGLIKRQLQSAATAGLAEVLAAEAMAQAQAFATEDLREGARAYREKRTPRFAGR